jgi:hypothetical protein
VAFDIPRDRYHLDISENLSGEDFKPFVTFFTAILD